MGIVELVTVLGAVFGGASSGLSFVSKFQELRSYELLSDQLTKLAHFKSSEKESSNLEFMAEHNSEGHYKEIIKWIKYADLLMAPVRAKLIRRFASAILVIIGGLIVIPLNLPNYLIPEVQTIDNLEAIDIPWFVAMLTYSLSFAKKFTASPEEIVFMENMSALQDAYYNRYVSPAMANFNNHCKHYFANEVAARESKIEEMQSDINRIKNRLDSMK